MAHKARPRSQPTFGQWWPCSTCGKRTFGNKAAAKRAIKFLRRGGDAKMRDYKSCDGEGFHIGHLHEGVRCGVYTRDQVYTQDRTPHYLRDTA